MQQRSGKFVQLWLMLLTVVCAAVVGYLIVWLASGTQSVRLPRPRAVLGVSEEDVTATNSSTTITRQTATSDGQTPATPTFVPLSSATTDLPSTEAATTEIPPAEPAPTEVAVLPPIASPGEPTLPPPTRAIPAATQAPPPAVPVVGTSVRLEETVWRGGWQQSRRYGGRNATWIYGTGTNYSTMQAAFVVDTQPSGEAALTVEGMDSEDRAKTPIRISINGTEIYNGPNPLPNDDLPLETGTWSSYTWRFNANLVQPGTNVIRISTLIPGKFRQPPFFMLDYAILSFQGEANNAVPVIPPTDVPPTPAPPTAIPTDLPPPTAPPVVPTETLEPTPDTPPEPTVEPTVEPTPG